MKNMHSLAVGLLCAGCGGDGFSASALEAPVTDGGVEITESGGAPMTHTSGGAATAEGGSGGAGGADAAGAGSGGIGEGGSAAGAPSSDAGVSGGSGGAPTTEMCETGATRCAGSQPEVCAGDGWFKSGGACSGSAPMCLEGHCVECAPGTEECLSPNEPGVCGPDGFWTPKGSACTLTEPRCLGNECVACDPSTVADYCPACPGSAPCCKTTAGDGCGCVTFEGCR